MILKTSKMKEEVGGDITGESICSDGLISLLGKFPHYGQKKSRVSFVQENQFQELLWRTADVHHAEISVPCSKLLLLELQGDVQPGNRAA